MKNLASNRTDGWPKDSGPIRTLHKLGLIADPAIYPFWLRFPATVTHDDGRITYKASTAFLRYDCIRALAALSFEGWNVIVNSAAGRLDIKVSAQTEPTEKSNS